MLTSTRERVDVLLVDEDGARDRPQVAAHVRDHEVADLKPALACEVSMSQVAAPGAVAVAGRESREAVAGAEEVAAAASVGGVHVGAPFTPQVWAPSDYSTNGWFV